MPFVVMAIMIAHQKGCAGGKNPQSTQIFELE